MSTESLKAINLAVSLEGDHGFSEVDQLIAADKADVDYFENMMNVKPDPISQDIVQGAEFVSNNLQQKKHEFEAALKKASDTAAPADVLAAARSLSEYSIQTSIVAKAAGKSSQAVDKVTNLH